MPPPSPAGTSPRGADPAVTELEGAVLAVVGRERSITAYAVRKQFERSRSWRFSGSAGAIYPVVERLAGRGLLRATRDTDGRRGKRLYALTPAGRAELRRWLLDVDGPRAGPPDDPLRTRVLFLGALPASRRAGGLDAAVEATRAALTRERAERRALSGDDPWLAAAVDGAIAELEARLRWLRGLRATLDG